ncbi:6,7-dimethyl-8-ribityllumazine synthase [Neomegalonema sp.]|uniref:6,7-dimethyl-8-ribityllumazine synthase n=1 Tax=Neomegalonema sp. TaxID=2039713 RepID=UPI00260D9A44|nr:6,7-dimethyl-8-ribityllumazine synthase [Neomegalonema sp.]MDD2867218.1 6,7-dimethyl-8-ribityllumazine synthase [Neomegalonema sp.]
MAESEAPAGPPPKVPAGTRVLLVVAPFYRDIADLLIEGARARLKEAGASADLVEVPGALEIPGAVALAAGSGRYDGYVGLGCVIRGETTHYETVCEESARGLMDLTLKGEAVGNGILTVETRKQALKRANPEKMNKGAGAADAALALIALRAHWGAPEPVGARRSSFAPDSEHIVVASAGAGRHG